MFIKVIIYMVPIKNNMTKFYISTKLIITDAYFQLRQSINHCDNCKYIFTNYDNYLDR